MAWPVHRPAVLGLLPHALAREITARSIYFSFMFLGSFRACAGAVGLQVCTCPVLGDRTARVCDRWSSLLACVA